MMAFDFKAAIFDLDGTLIDSTWVWNKIDIDFLTKRNIKAPKVYGQTISALSFLETAKYTIELFNLKETPEELMKEWNDMAIHEYSNNVKLKDHVKEYLMLLKSLNIKLGIATNASEVLYEPVLKNNGVYDLFDVICGTHQVGKGKESPEIFVFVSQKLGVSPEKCIVFEDILPAIISAKKAGMTCFGVYDHGSNHQKLAIQTVADGYLYDFRDAPVP